MHDPETSRLSRLTAILVLLQSQRLVTATRIAEKFHISIRTAYRDIRALEEAGIPILTEEGKGYSLMPGYTLPPVMLSEEEANALITARQIIATNNDRSLVHHYTAAITRICAVLKHHTRDKAELLSERIQIRTYRQQERTSDRLATIQLSITNFNRIRITYRSETTAETRRIVEPLALYSTQEHWVMIAYCRLRKAHRAFRLDRIEALQVLDEHFPPHDFTLQQYFEDCKNKLQHP